MRRYRDMARAFRRSVVGLVVVAGVLPAAALAAIPVAGTRGVTVEGPGTVVVYGLADPWGPETTIHVSFARLSEAWCESHGKEGAPSSTPTVLLGRGNVIVEVFIQGGGLIPKTEYCAELVVENEDGIGRGGQAPFTTSESSLVEEREAVPAPINTPTPFEPPVDQPWILEAIQQSAKRQLEAAEAERRAREAATREVVQAEPPPAAPPPSPRCVVPRIVGRSLDTARHLLDKAHCRIGTVTRTRKHGVLVVLKQSHQAGSLLRNG